MQIFHKLHQSTITCTPVLSKIVPSGAYVVPLTLYSESCGPCKTEWTTQIWTETVTKKENFQYFRQTKKKKNRENHMMTLKLNQIAFLNLIFHKSITFETDIIFVVKVPVLSLHITVVQPKVSTDGKDLTIAFRRAILLVPRAKHLQVVHENYEHLQTR